MLNSTDAANVRRYCNTGKFKRTLLTVTSCLALGFLTTSSLAVAQESPQGNTSAQSGSTNASSSGFQGHHWHRQPHHHRQGIGSGNGSASSSGSTASTSSTDSSSTDSSSTDSSSTDTSSTTTATTSSIDGNGTGVPAVTSTVTTTGAASPLKVSGTKLVDATGKTVVLHGVAKMGTEYMCEGGGVFDNSGWGSDDNSPPGTNFMQALASWKVNVVRIPLAEDCWLNTNGVATGGTAYQTPIIAFVKQLNTAGIYVILDLHVVEYNASQGPQRYDMADTDHSLAFWTSVANTFKGDNAVIFDLYNEPQNIDAACWLNGGCTTSQGYQAAGMQQMLNNVRATGASNVVMIGGLDDAGEASAWVSNPPKDTLNPSQLAVSWHAYDVGFTWNCGSFDASCLDPDFASDLAGTPSTYPVITGEFGEIDTCASEDSFVNAIMTYLDGLGESYVAWTFNINSSCPGPYLISDSSGTPLPIAATAIKAHYLSGSR